MSTKWVGDTGSRAFTAVDCAEHVTKKFVTDNALSLNIELRPALSNLIEAYENRVVKLIKPPARNMELNRSQASTLSEFLEGSLCLVKNYPSPTIIPAISPYRPVIDNGKLLRAATYMNTRPAKDPAATWMLRKPDPFFPTVFECIDDVAKALLVN